MRCLLSFAALSFLLLTSCTPDAVATHGDTTPPHVAISGITEGQTIFSDTAATVVASDADSTVSEIVLYLDGSQIDDETFASFEASISFTILDNRDNAGPHQLVARAYDAAGNRSDFTVDYSVFAP